MVTDDARARVPEHGDWTGSAVSRSQTEARADLALLGSSIEPTDPLLQRLAGLPMLKVADFNDGYPVEVFLAVPVGTLVDLAGTIEDIKGTPLVAAHGFPAMPVFEGIASTNPALRQQHGGWYMPNALVDGAAARLASMPDEVFAAVVRQPEVQSRGHGKWEVTMDSLQRIFDRLAAGQNSLSAPHGERRRSAAFDLSAAKGASSSDGPAATMALGTATAETGSALEAGRRTGELTGKHPRLG